MCLNAEKELEIRDALTAKVQAVTGTSISGADPNVFNTPWFFANREDFAATVGVSTNIKALEIKFAQVHYLNFTDTGRGTDECPELEVRYNILMFRQWIQSRKSDNTRSYNDYVAWIMRTMRAFFVNRDLTNEASIIRFEQPEFIAVNQESNYIPNEKGIFCTLQAVVEVK